MTAHKQKFLFLIIFLLLVSSVSAWNFEGDAVTIKGAVDTLSQNDFFLDISQGLVTDHSSQFKFGRSSVGASEEVVWDGGGDYVFLNNSETMVVVSDDAADVFNGLGARTIIIFGLDNNFSEITELVVMNGTSPVTTSNSFKRVYRVLVLTSGIDSPVSDANQGTITITTSGTSILQAQINPTNGQTLMSVYTIPACHNAYVTGVGASVPEGKSVLVKYKFRNTEQSLNGAFSIKYTLDLFEQSINQMLKVPLEVSAKTDIAITASSAAAGTSIGVSFGIILIKIDGCVV